MISFGLKLQHRNRIPELSKQLRRRGEAKVNKAAYAMAAIAKQLCPVSDIDTPGYEHMVDTIAVETYAGSGTAKAVVVNKPYAPYVEATTPFLMPAFEAVRARLLEDLNDLLKL